MERFYSFNHETDVPFSAIYWTSYESIRHATYNESTGFNSNSRSLSFSFLSGCISGGIAAFVTHPFDVLKTLDQVRNGTASKPVITAIRDIYDAYGLRGLYVGLVPRLGRVAPACGIMITTYEFGKLIL